MAEVAPMKHGAAVPALPIRSAHGRSTRARSSLRLQKLDPRTTPGAGSRCRPAGARQADPAAALGARRSQGVVPDPAALPAAVALR